MRSLTKFWIILFSHKYRVSKRVRFEVVVDWLRELFSDWWLLISSIVLSAIGLSLVLGFGLIELEPARWTLSALVQAGAALIGIFFVALSLLWNQATREREKLIGLMEFYMSIFWVTKSKDSKFGASESETVEELTNNMSLLCMYPAMEKEKFTWDRSGRIWAADIRVMVTACSLSLLVLEYASSLYKPGGLPLDELISHAEVTTWGLKIKAGQKDMIRREATKLSLSEVDFFSYLLVFDNRLSELERKAKLDSKVSVLFSDYMFRARRVDTVGVSLSRIYFFNSFGGNGLKVVSSMWLLCLTMGLFFLVSLDRIPNHILPWLVSATVTIGVLALGTTLSLGFRAMRLKRQGI